MSKFFTDAKEKNLARIDALSRIIVRIMDEEKSQYVTAKKYVGLSEQTLAINTSRSYHHLKKAYLAASREAEIAKMYRQSYEILRIRNELNEYKVSQLNSDYLKAIATGNLRKAKKCANRLYIKANSAPIPKGIEASVTKGEGVGILFTNQTDQNVLIESLTVTSTKVKVEYPFQMSKGISPGGQLSVPLTYASDVPFKVNVSVQYTQGVKTENRYFELEVPSS